MDEFFEAFSGGKETLLIEHLFVEAEASAEEAQSGHKNWDLLLEHICKSLNFKGVSLDEAWGKYYINTGFIS